MKIIINAFGLNKGGGQVLFEELINSLDNNQYIILKDKRLNISIRPDNITEYNLPQFFFSRIIIDVFLYIFLKKDDLYLSLNSLPPLLKYRSKNFLYVHNKFIFEKEFLSQGNIFINIKCFFQRMIFFLFKKNINVFFVQSFTNKNLLMLKNIEASKVKVFPFMPVLSNYKKNNSTKSIKLLKKYDFVYISSGEKHKNHLKLFQAWSILADSGIFPFLFVTLDPVSDSYLCSKLNQFKNKGLNIINLGKLPYAEVLSLYKYTKCLIYPSSMESFGLPLLESRYYKIPILAPELDYVRDVVCPAQTFDPKSSISIARAVKRFLGIQDRLEVVYNGKKFIKEILGS